MLGCIAFRWVTRDFVVVVTRGETEKCCGLSTNQLRVTPRERTTGPPPSLGLSFPIGGGSQTTEPFTSKILKNWVSHLCSLSMCNNIYCNSLKQWPRKQISGIMIKKMGTIFK